MQGNGVFIIVIIKVKTCFLIFPPVNLGKPTEFRGLCTLWRCKHIVIFPVSLIIGYSVNQHTYKAYHNPQTYKNRETLKNKRRNKCQGTGNDYQYHSGMAQGIPWFIDLGLTFEYGRHNPFYKWVFRVIVKIFFTIVINIHIHSSA